MIRGYCIGGGLGLAVCCDLRICSDNSRFAVPAAKLGLGYSYAGLRRLTDVVGPAFATRDLLHRAPVRHRGGAGDGPRQPRRAARPELETYVKSYAETIAANAPLTVKAVKYIVGEVMKDEITSATSRAAPRWWKQCFASNDFIEGRSAFMEKRKPAFHRYLTAGADDSATGRVTAHSVNIDDGLLITARRQAVADANQRFGVSIAEDDGGGTAARASGRTGVASVELRGLTKRYGDLAVVDDVSLTIEHGRLVCLLGPSGCGKTTTLRLIAGFVEPIGRRDPGRRPASCPRRRARCRRSGATCR